MSKYIDNGDKRWQLLYGMKNALLAVGYDRRKNRDGFVFRPMSYDEAAALGVGDRVWFLALDGTARGVKINGMPKQWKRTPGKMEIPIKYGMYEYGKIRFYGYEYTSDSPILLMPTDNDPLFTP